MGAHRARTDARDHLTELRAVGAAIGEFSDPRLVAVYETLNDYELGTQPDFCREVATEMGATTILDVGCGTGLITRELARLGYRMIGVDPAPEMLKIARRKPYGDRVRWIEGGAAAAGDAGADLALMTGHVAQFFLTDEEWDANLIALHGALRPGGTLAFESRNPGAREWERWTRFNKRSADDAEAGRIDAWSQVWDVQDGIVSYTNFYFFAATGRLVAAQGKLRFRTEAELTQSLADAGFTVRLVYGDWGRQPVRPSSPELIFVAVRD